MPCEDFLPLHDIETPQADDASTGAGVFLYTCWPRSLLLLPLETISSRVVQDRDYLRSRSLLHMIVNGHLPLATLRLNSRLPLIAPDPHSLISLVLLLFGDYWLLYFLPLVHLLL